MEFTGRNNVLFRLTRALVLIALRTICELAVDEAVNVSWDGTPVPTRLAIMLMDGCRAVSIRRILVVCVSRATCRTESLILPPVITTRLVTLLIIMRTHGQGVIPCRELVGVRIPLVCMVLPKLPMRWNLKNLRLEQCVLTLPIIYLRVRVVPPGLATTGASRRGTFVQVDSLMCPGLITTRCIRLGAVCTTTEASTEPTKSDPLELAVFVISRRGTPARLVAMKRFLMLPLTLESTGPGLFMVPLECNMLFKRMTL